MFYSTAGLCYLICCESLICLNFVLNSWCWVGISFENYFKRVRNKKKSLPDDIFSKFSCCPLKRIRILLLAFMEDTHHLKIWLGAEVLSCLLLVFLVSLL